MWKLRYKKINTCGERTKKSLCKLLKLSIMINKTGDIK